MSDQQNTPDMLESIRKNGFLLMAFALVCTLLLSVINLLTKPVIAEQQQLQQQKSLSELLDANAYDNQPALNCTKLTSSALGDNKTVFRAYQQNQPYAAVFEVTAADGYSGNIDLLVAVDINGQVLGVRAIAHKETPGLGDKIDLNKSDWILGFNGKKLTESNISQWAVKKDGGVFDGFTGATITPRAVVKAVKKTLEYFKENQAVLFSSTNQCEVTS
jgi:electron transport complex protein RnfG